MRTFKIIDAWLQVTIILAGLIFCIFYPDDFINVYFITGGWQLVSCLTHEFLKKHYYPDPGRRRYLVIVLITILLTLVLLLALELFEFPGIVIYAFLLLLLSPVLAIFYTSICFSENRILRHKMLVHLK